MKVVQINAVCGVGSTGRICQSLSQLLSQAGVENYVLYAQGESTYPLGIKYMEDWEIKAGALASRIGGNDGFNNRQSTRRLLSRLDSIRPDVVHLHNLHGHNVHLSMLLDYLRTHGIRTYWTFHDCWAFTGYCTHYDTVGCDRWRQGCGTCPLWHSRSWFRDRSAGMAARKTALLRALKPTVVTPSRWLAGQVKQSLIEEDCPVEVIPNGIDLSVFTPTDSDFRRRYGLVGKSVILAVAYAWNRQKGLDVLCDMAARLDGNCRLVMVGTDPAVEHSLPPSVLPIRRTDSPRELAAIYTAADVLVNPTREENYPTVNMEAIACGTPVVTFDTGGCRETVPPACGAVVPKGDGEALYREAMAACTAGRYTAGACVTAAAAFDKDACFGRYLALWGVPQPRRQMQESTK